MSTLRVDKLESPSGTIIFEGTTTFSGTGSFGIPGGTADEQSQIPIQSYPFRFASSDKPNVAGVLEYYNGNFWVAV